jgi:hypothetical protein
LLRVLSNRCAVRAGAAKIWYGWLFAAHAFEVPNPGDYITLTVDASPVLVMRDDSGKVRAFHNAFGTAARSCAARTRPTRHCVSLSQLDLFAQAS